MRHERLTQALALALELQASRRGLTLADMQERFGVSRRTAERHLQALGVAFGWVEPVDGDGRRKRWRMRAPALRHLVRVSPDELAELNAAAESLQRAGLRERAQVVRALGTKLRAMRQGRSADEAEADFEALTRAEGVAMRPGPRQQLAEGLLALLRRCVLERCVLALDYIAQGTAKRSHLRVCPHGILYGNRAFLVAPVEGAETMRLWRLGNIENPQATGEIFERDANFDLQRYAKQSFGTFQEAPANVVLRFPTKAARDARAFVFHPDQRLREHPDGVVTVSFKAGGFDELCWHLVTWGEQVTVERPARLRRRLAKMCATLAAHHGGDGGDGGDG